MNSLDLTTTYLGLKLRNPFIVSSSGLTSTYENVVACQDAGAGAVILKSIFEEQISGEATSLEQYSDYPEAADYLSSYVENSAIGEYLELIERCSKGCEIPIIASINCSSKGSWIDYARQIQSAGAAALELNIFVMPTDSSTTSVQIEAKYLSIVESVIGVVSIPISVKLPMNFTSPLNIVQQLHFRGVKGVTMFNRFYSPDIDTAALKVSSAGVMSHPEELSNVIRWLAMASAQLPLIDIAASTGIHSAQGAIKALLSGATVVELCSVLYAKKVDYLSVIIEEFTAWASQHSYDSVSQFRGLLNAKSQKSAEIYERAQFMRYFSTHKE